MLPINEAERKKAFWNFFLLFSITIAVILIAVFFSIYMPFKEVDKLRKENELAYNERVSLQKFEVKMQETMTLIDSVNTSRKLYQINPDIDQHLAEMNGIAKDSITNSTQSLCIKVLENLNSLRTAKQQIRDANNSTAESEDKDKQIEKLQNALEERNKQIAMYLQQINKN